MLLVKTHIGNSPIHGLGCFATEDIRKGTIVWRLDPVFDTHLDVAKIETLPVMVRGFLGVYGYIPSVDGGRTLILCGDHARHMNHDDDPNVIESADETNIAARDIRAGEELTCDYRAFDSGAASKLGHS